MAYLSSKSNKLLTFYSNYVIEHRVIIIFVKLFAGYGPGQEAKVPSS
jgi:hypothetical protein